MSKLHKFTKYFERMNCKYYYIWIEGLSARYGEKIKSITNGNIEYTHKITEAMRVRPQDLLEFKDLLREIGIADWVIDNESTYVPTTYSPTKIWKP